MLPKPTIDLVREKCASIETDPFTILGDDALGQLLSKFPHNTQAGQVLLKVIALDKRYSTRIRYKDMDCFARHIANSGTDELIAKGSLDAVELIWSCEGIWNYYSFATKFCSWHNPTAFPITTGTSISVCGHTNSKIGSRVFVAKISENTKNWSV